MSTGREESNLKEEWARISQIPDIKKSHMPCSRSFGKKVIFMAYCTSQWRDKPFYIKHSIISHPSFNIYLSHLNLF